MIELFSICKYVMMFVSDSFGDGIDISGDTLKLLQKCSIAVTFSAMQQVQPTRLERGHLFTSCNVQLDQLITYCVI